MKCDNECIVAAAEAMCNSQIAIHWFTLWSLCIEWNIESLLFTKCDTIFCIAI